MLLLQPMAFSLEDDSRERGQGLEGVWEVWVESDLVRLYRRVGEGGGKS